MSRSMDGIDSQSGLDLISVAKHGKDKSRNFLLLLFTFAFVAGNLLLQRSSNLVSPKHILIFFCMLVLVLVLYSRILLALSKYVSQHLIFILIISGLFLGYTRAWLQAGHYLKYSLAPDVMSQDVQIPACISSIPQKQADFSRFIIQPIEYSNSSTDIGFLRKIRLSANLKQLEKTNPEIQFKAGDCWDWTLRLKTTRGLRNQHGFDYEKWLYLQDVGATAYLKSMPQKLSINKYPWLAFRAKMAQEIKQALPDNSHITGLILGLSLGIRDDISTEQWQVLQNTGTSHLLAISGLHIGIAALFGFYLGKLVYFFLVKLRLQRESHYFSALNVALIFSMIFAVFYAALAGFSVSTQRACIMLLLASLCSMGAKKIKAKSVLCLALLSVLLIDPKASLSAGTWFSFLAVVVLLYLITREKKLRLSKVTLLGSQNKNLKLAMKLQFFLVLFLSIPVAYVFSKVSIISPLVNFFLIPIFTFTVVPILLIALLSIKFAPEFSFTLMNWQHAWLNLLWELIEIASELPIAHIELQIKLGIALTFLILLVPYIFPKGIFSRKFSFVLILPFVFGFTAKNIKPEELRISVFDVGQGLSVFLQTAEHQLLFDTGPAFRSGSSAAERVIIPWMQAEHIDSISALVVSHSDNDHAGGYELIKNSLRPKLVFAPREDTIQYSHACEAGYSWHWDGVEFEFIYPFKNIKSKKKNNYSCVLRVSLHGKSLLLTGDIEKEAEHTLLIENADMQSDIVIVPHHGSRTSSTAEFVNSVRPQIAVIPAGFANRWRFPKGDVLQRWQSASKEVYTISETGELNFHVNKLGEITSQTWISRQCRYWHQDCQN